MRESPAARLAAVVAHLGDAAWNEDVARLAGGPAPPAVEPPTYGEVARAGLCLVEALAAQERWGEAARQARHLTRFFSGERQRLHAVAGHTFDGLQAAALARDPDELADFAELIREIFP